MAQSAAARMPTQAPRLGRATAPDRRQYHCSFSLIDRLNNRRKVEQRGAMERFESVFSSSSFVPCWLQIQKMMYNERVNTSTSV